MVRMLSTRVRRHAQRMSYECRRATVTHLHEYALLQIDK